MSTCALVEQEAWASHDCSTEVGNSKLEGSSSTTGYLWSTGYFSCSRMVMQSIVRSYWQYSKSGDECEGCKSPRTGGCKPDDDMVSMMSWPTLRLHNVASAKASNVYRNDTYYCWAICAKSKLRWARWARSSLKYVRSATAASTKSITQACSFHITTILIIAGMSICNLLHSARRVFDSCLQKAEMREILLKNDKRKFNIRHVVVKWITFGITWFMLADNPADSSRLPMAGLWYKSSSLKSNHCQTRESSPLNQSTDEIHDVGM